MNLAEILWVKVILQRDRQFDRVFSERLCRHRSLCRHDLDVPLIVCESWFRFYLIFKEAGCLYIPEQLKLKLLDRLSAFLVVADDF